MAHEEGDVIVTWVFNHLGELGHKVLDGSAADHLVQFTAIARIVVVSQVFGVFQKVELILAEGLKMQHFFHIHHLGITFSAN